MIFCLALLTLFHESQGVEPQMPRFLGKFDVAHAGFVEVFDREDGGKDLYITSFNPALPFFHDPVFFLRDPGNYLTDVTSWPEHLSTLGTKATAYWPNFPVQVPKEVLGFEAVVQTSGFLVPGKTAGQIELFDTSAGQQGENRPIVITSDARDGHDWSYHWVVWKDIDNDGLVDALTARFRVPPFGGDPISQLIWLKNPGTAPPAPGQDWPWQHFIQSTGPDVYFEEETFQVCPTEGDCFEYSAIVTAELWTERVMIYYVVNEPGAWANPANMQSMVVDTGNVGGGEGWAEVFPFRCRPVLRGSLGRPQQRRDDGDPGQLLRHQEGERDGELLRVSTELGRPHHALEEIRHRLWLHRQLLSLRELHDSWKEPPVLAQRGV